MNRKFIANICLSMLMAFVAMPALAQNQTVTGTVVDENGEPVIGASVMVAGTKTGTVTDLNGTYKLDVPKGKKVTISYIGYLPQTVVPGGQVSLQEDRQSLDEVVVVGYGSQKKAHLTGSVATVDMNDVQDISAGGLASTLSGLVNGMSVTGGDQRPGERATIKIRDTNSLGALGVTTQEPLFVIDGYVYPNDIKVGDAPQNLGAEAFNNLDPSEVESISVLKDASAAVYGSRAANGVILVTTKKGKIGKPTVSYNGTFGFTDEVSRPKMLSSYEYGRLYNAVAAADPTNTSLNVKRDLFQYDELEAMRGLNYDLLDDNWKTAFTHQHSVNVSGATERVSYFGGISYFDQNGNLGKLDYNRWNYRAGIDVKLSKWLGANLTISGDYGKKNKPNVKVGGSTDEKDYNLLNSRPRYIPEYVGEYDIPFYGVSNTEKNLNQTYNYSLLQNNGDYKRTMTNNMNINASVSYDFGWSKILQGLKVKFSYSKSINNSKGNEYGSHYTLYKMNTRYGSGEHLYTPSGSDLTGVDFLSRDNFTKLDCENGDYLSRTTTRTDNYQMNLTLNYARDFGHHHVGALFAIEKSEAESEYLEGKRMKPYPFTTGQWNSAEGDMSTRFTRSESGTLSYIWRLNYAYADRYLFEFLIRSDASTKFAPKNYWGTFPSLSAGWVVSEEPWFQNVKWLKWVDFLKLRVSWGMTGRDNVEAWKWAAAYAQDADKGVVFGSNIGAASSNRVTINKRLSAVNTDMHWDKSYKTNVGLDFQVLNKRLAVTIDYYKERNREMLLAITQNVPGTVGTQSAKTNLGEMNNWGWEFSLNWRDKIGKDFKYRIGLNTGFRDNEVLVADWEKGASKYMSIREGYRTDMGLWGMQCIGMFRSFQEIEEYFDTYLKKEDGTYGTYMTYTKDKVRPGMLIYKDVRGPLQEDGTYAAPDHSVDETLDQVQLSNRTNPYGVTINAGCEWKGISLTTQFSANWGGYTVVPGAALKPNGNLEYSNMPSFWNVDNMFSYQTITDEAGNVLVEQNLDGYYPNLAYSDVNAVASSFWRVSAARVQLNRLTIAYTLPNKWYKKYGINNVRFNITGQNLINFYNPLPDKFTSPMAGTYGSYPNLRKWTIGVNLSF
ncbi:MAG: TonB-dependent receptor [Prevotella sp.]|nr:TonB-dependent receptor [Prevotella sp.]